jgi:hypothetical protein
MEPVPEPSSQASTSEEGVADAETDRRRGDADDGDDGLDRLLGRLDAVRVLSERDEDEALAELEALAVQGRVETEMVAELAVRDVLAHPDRFVTSHVALMKALEVLDRNGGRTPELRIGGPLRPAATVLVQTLARLQVERYQRTVLSRVGDLYRRREAQSIAGSHEHVMLRRARWQVDRLLAEAPSGGLAITGLLLGGAALSFLGAAVSSVLDAINAHWWALLLTVLVFVAIALATCWVLIRSAATARRRIRITIDQPLAALYETVGGAGEPPDDPTRQFTLYSLLALIVGWVVVPAALGLLLWPD